MNIFFDKLAECLAANKLETFWIDLQIGKFRILLNEIIQFNLKNKKNEQVLNNKIDKLRESIIKFLRAKKNNLADSQKDDLKIILDLLTELAIEINTNFITDYRANFNRDYLPTDDIEE